MRANATLCCSPTDSTFAQSRTSLRRMTMCDSATLTRACWISRSLTTPSSRGVGRGGAEVAEGQVRHLRDEHRFLPGRWKDDAAGYEGPQSCEALQQNGLAGCPMDR